MKTKINAPDPRGHHANDVDLEDTFDFHPCNLAIRGSAHLGFSIAPRPEKVWVALGPGSDLDVALVSMAIGLWQGPLAMIGQGILYMFVLAPLINGLGHWRGAQNFGNTAYNSRVLAWVTGGESLHNNHHAFPRSPKFSLRRSELDPSWIAIRVLAALRLVVVLGDPLRARPSR